MKPLQHIPVYSRKRSLRSTAPEVNAFPPLKANAVRATELRTFREPPRLISPVISHATQHIELTLYELLGMVELMRVAYEKGELSILQNQL